MITDIDGFRLVKMPRKSNMNMKLMLFACLPFLSYAQHQLESPRTHSTVLLDQCNSGYIKVNSATIVPYTADGFPDTNPRCDGIEWFRILCEWEPVCSLNRSSFTGGQCGDDIFIRLEYGCYDNPTMRTLQDLNREFAASETHVFSSAQYPEFPQQVPAAKCVLENIHGPTFTLTELHAYATSQAPRSVLWMATQVNQSGSDIVLRSDPNQRYTNFNTLLDAPLHSLYITYHSVTDARFVLILSANTTVRMCCHQNDTWPVCDEPPERNTKATLMKNADKSSIDLSLILGLVFGVLALVVMAAVVVLVVVRRRNRHRPLESPVYENHGVANSPEPDYAVPDYNNRDPQPYASLVV